MSFFTGLIVALVRVKLYAIILGPAGFGVVSQLYNFYLLFTNIIHFGVPVSITSETSKINNVESRPIINSYFRYIVSRILLVTLFFSFVIILLSEPFSYFLVDSVEYSFFIKVIFISAPFTVAYFLIEAFLKGCQEITKIVKINVFTNVTSTLIFIPLIYLYNIWGVSIYLMIFGLLPVLVSIIVAKKFISTISKPSSYILARKEKMIIFKLGAVSLISSLMHQGVIIYLRKIIIGSYGLDENGIYQSVLSISLTYFGLLYVFLSNYTLPKLAECKNDINLVAELNINARFLILLIFPMISIFYTYKEFGVLLLYSPKFLNAGTLFFPQLIGDIFRVGAALLGLWMIPRHKIKQIIIIDIIFNSIFVILLVVFVNLLALPLFYVSIAYLLSFLSHFIMYFIYSKHSIKFKFEKKIKMTMVYSSLLLLLTFLLQNYNKDLAQFLLFAVLLIWFLMVVELHEIRNMKEVLKNYFKKLID